MIVRWPRPCEDRSPSMVTGGQAGRRFPGPLTHDTSMQSAPADRASASLQRPSVANIGPASVPGKPIPVPVRCPCAQRSVWRWSGSITPHHSAAALGAHSLLLLLCAVRIHAEYGQHPCSPYSATRLSPASDCRAIHDTLRLPPCRPVAESVLALAIGHGFLAMPSCCWRFVHNARHYAQASGSSFFARTQCGPRIMSTM